jgi:hypothetical protein
MTQSGHPSSVAYSAFIDMFRLEKWDARHNAGSGRATQSNWVLALLLVATMLVGCTALIATIARLFDLLHTGGAYG